MKRVVGVEKIKLRVNPEDEKLIKELKPELLQMLDSKARLALKQTQRLKEVDVWLKVSLEMLIREYQRNFR